MTMSLITETSSLPGLYEHYTQGGIQSGLSTDQSYFTLNGKNISIYSGAVHYFRVHPDYWRDRLRKMRHAGLNTVETYVPWNLHEPEPGKFDFGKGKTDWQDFLNLEKFLKIAQEEDLLAIVRPGPFICAEWEFGGFPSWLLREKNLKKVRTSDPYYMKHVTRFFNYLLPILAALQFTKGGPIIAFQVENEYGSTERISSVNPFKPDLKYVQDLINLMKNHDIRELLLSSDNPLDHSDRGTIPSELFQTANFNSNPEKHFDKLKVLQGNRPAMCMEFWAGWFDHWFEKHYNGNVSNFQDIYERILKYPASVNLYMFHGGTSFGFMNGANIKGRIDQPFSDIQRNYQPDITSYDYDAPLTEYGDYNPKYFVVKNLIEKYNSVKTRLPDYVTPPKLIRHQSISITDFMSLYEFLLNIKNVAEYENVVPMELLDVNNNTGQSYGYVVYRKKNLDLSKNFTIQFDGYVFDAATIYLNGNLLSKKPKSVNDINGFGFYRQKNALLTFNISKPLKNATIDIMVENMGRNNFGQLEWFNQFKGLQNNIYINNQEVKNYEIIPLEFKKSFTKTIPWQNTSNITKKPGIYKAILKITKNDKHDTFLDMRNWTWGIVIINGFILGRYNNLGPQHTLYLPAPLLNIGNNEIIVFEKYLGSNIIHFSDKPIYNL